MSEDNGTEQLAAGQEKKSLLLSGVFLTLIVFAVLFGLAEMVVRILYKDETVMFPRYHTDVLYGDYTLRRIRPNSKFVHTSIDGSWKFTTNAQGFRNFDDFAYAKADGVVRVMAIGDSHTQGYEVDQDYTFASIIEKFLRKNGVNAQVFNTGVSGFSNAEQLLLLENELVNYSPDYIVLGFFANDFQDNIKSGLFKIEDGQLVSTGKMMHIPGVKIQNAIYAVPGVQWLSENSYFYSMLFNSVWLYAKRLLLQQSIDKVMEVAVPTKSEFGDYEKDLARLIIRRMHHSAKSMGAKLVILDIPTIGPEGLPTPSIGDNFYATIKGDSDFFQSSKMFRDYRGVGRVHVTHGHKHISEFTHTMLGVEAGKYIMADLNPEPLELVTESAVETVFEPREDTSRGQ